MAEFTTESIFEALKSPLGVIDNPERRKQIEDYIDAAKRPLDQAIAELLSSFTEAVDGSVAAHYEARLTYRPGVLSVDVREREPSEPEDETWSTAEGDVEKITLRIPAELKDMATDAAAKSGLSVNSWFVRVLARALRGSDTPEPPPRRRERRRGHGGKRLSGWVGPD